MGAGLSYCLVDGIKFRVSGGASLPIGSAQIVNSDDNTAVYLARDAAGFYARSAICTHQCCLLEMCLDNECLDIVTNPGTCSSSAAGIPPKKGGVLFCACHGSAFDADGNALNGPARDPLPAVFVEIDGADIVVDTSRPAAVADRAAK